MSKGIENCGYPPPLLLLAFGFYVHVRGFIFYLLVFCLPFNIIFGVSLSPPTFENDVPLENNCFLQY